MNTLIMEEVESIDEVDKRPVAPNVTVYYKDKTKPYIYSKSNLGDNRFEKKAYELNEVDYESLKPENKQIVELTGVVHALANEIMSLKSQLSNLQPPLAESYAKGQQRNYDKKKDNNNVREQVQN